MSRHSITQLLLEMFEGLFKHFLWRLWHPKIKIRNRKRERRGDSNSLLTNSSSYDSEIANYKQNWSNIRGKLMKIENNWSESNRSENNDKDNLRIWLVGM